MSVPEILAALKSLEATFSNYFVSINNNFKELQNSIDSRSSHLQSTFSDSHITTLLPVIDDEPRFLTNSSSSITDLHGFLPSLSQTSASKPKIVDNDPRSPPKSEPYSFTKSFPPIFDISPTYVTDLSIASDLQRSLSNGVVLDGSPSDLQKPPSNLQKSPFDLQESRSSLTDIADPNSALSQPTPPLTVRKLGQIGTKRVTPIEIDEKKEQMFGVDQKWPSFRRRHSHSVWLIGTEDGYDSEAPERSLKNIGDAATARIISNLQILSGSLTPHSVQITVFVDCYPIQVMEFITHGKQVMLCSEPQPEFSSLIYFTKKKKRCV